MIKRVFSNLPKFKAVEFSAGFNMVLAERTKESTKKDTRNGLGKSTLLDIIHFCLGSRLQKGDRLLHPDLSEAAFGLELELQGRKIIVERSRQAQSYVLLSGDILGLSIDTDKSNDRVRLEVVKWIELLGLIGFAAPVDSTRKYKPSFRSLISYLIRRGKGAFTEPFRHFSMQATWDIQV